MSDPLASPEGDLDPTDPYVREAQTFPRLNKDMQARIGAYGSEEDLAKGTYVFEHGQRMSDFFVVLDGTIEIFDVDPNGQAQTIRVHREGEFTGDVDLFNERRIVVSGRAGADARVIRVKRADFRRLVSLEADIGELIM